MSKGLSFAAQDHAKEIGTLGRVTHSGEDGSTIEDRCMRYGSMATGTFEEAIGYGEITGYEAAIQLAVDDGESTRPNQALLFGTVQTQIGVGSADHVDFNKVVVATFAKAFVEGSMPEGNRPSTSRPNWLENDYDWDFNVWQNYYRAKPKKLQTELTKMSAFFEDKGASSTLAQPNKAKVIFNEGKALFDATALWLSTAPVREALTFNQGLWNAARDHAEDLGSAAGSSLPGTGLGSDKSTTQTRLERYGKVTAPSSQTVVFGSLNGKEAVISAVLDDGQSTRPNRTNVFNDKYKLCGASQKVHPTYVNVVVVTYAAAYVEKPVGDVVKPTREQPTWMNDYEWGVFQWINRWRSNPSELKDLFGERIKYFNFKTLKLNKFPDWITNEGDAAFTEAQTFLAMLKPIATLTLTEGLVKAAQNHATFCGTNGVAGHIGDDGSTVEDRVNVYGNFKTAPVENVMPNAPNGKEAVFRMVADDGNNTRDNRNNIFATKFKQLGTGGGTGGKNPISVALFAEDFGQADKPSDDKPLSMNAYEWDFVEWQNKYRTNPQLAVDDLKVRLTLFDQGTNTLKLPGREPIITAEGALGVQNAIDYFTDLVTKKTKLKPLAQSKGLYLAALDHANDLGENGTVSHTGKDGSTYQSRTDKFGKSEGDLAENISLGEPSGKDAILSLLVDDGVPDRGHRINAMNPKLTLVGVANKDHKTYKQVLVVDYAEKYTDKAEEGTDNDSPLWPGRKPSVMLGYEWDFNNWLNYYRQNPTSLIPTLELRVLYFTDKDPLTLQLPKSKAVKTKEGAKPYTELIAYLKTAPRQGP